MPKGINIGSFRDRISFETATKTADGMGGFTLEWSEAFGVFADVKEAKGNRESRFDQIAYNVPYSIKLRYRNGDTAEPLNKYRINYNGIYLTIHSIIEHDESIIEILAYSTSK